MEINTDSRIALILYQYWRGGQELRKDFRELRGWAQRNGITPGPGEWLLTGRLCQEVKVGDILFTETGGRAAVRGLWAYGRSFESLEAGMTCGMLVLLEETNLEESENLYLK